MSLDFSVVTLQVNHNGTGLVKRGTETTERQCLRTGKPCSCRYQQWPVVDHGAASDSALRKLHSGTGKKPCRVDFSGVFEMQRTAHWAVGTAYMML